MRPWTAAGPRPDPSDSHPESPDQSDSQRLRPADASGYGREMPPVYPDQSDSQRLRPADASGYGREMPPAYPDQSDSQRSRTASALDYWRDSRPEPPDQNDSQRLRTASAPGYRPTGSARVQPPGSPAVPGRLPPGVPARLPSGTPALYGAPAHSPSAPPRQPPPMPPRQRTGGTTFVSRGPADPPAVLSLRGLAEAASAPQVDRLVATAGVLAVSLLGVVATYLADHEGRVHGSFGGLLYWLGQLLVFVPVIAAALQLRPPTKSEATLFAAGLGVNQYLMMWLYSPNQFRFPDELQHLTATSILNQSGRIFEANPALPVASGYPGLAEIGSAVSETTGLSITASGMIVAFVCRMVFIGALFAMVLRISRSPRAALITCVLYTTSAHYLFFNAYYVYQAGALAFALVAIWATLRLRWAASSPLTVIAVAASAATVVTHHITSAFLILVLMILGIASMMARPRTHRPILIGLGTLAFNVIWLAFPARATIAYFKPPLVSAWSSLTGLLGGGSSSGGGGAPSSKLALVIQLLALIIVFVIVVRTIAAMRAERRTTPFQWLLLAAAGTYFASSALHVAGAQGPELAGRASTFTFLPVAALIAWRADSWITERMTHRRPEPMRMRALAATGAAVLLMVAGRVGGWPPTWEMLPGKTIVSGFESAITPSAVNAAEWTKAWLGPDNRVGTDITGWTLVASYGGQSPVSEVSPLFYSADWTLADQVFVGNDGVDYLWVDATLARQKSITGSLFFNDSQSGHDLKPLPAANLAKFNNITFMRLVYDDGTIRIYDMRGLD